MLPDLEKYLEMTAKIVAKKKSCPGSPVTRISGFGADASNNDEATNTETPEIIPNSPHPFVFKSETELIAKTEKNSGTPSGSTSPQPSSPFISPFTSSVSLTTGQLHSNNFTSTFLFSTLSPAVTPPILTEKIFPVNSENQSGDFVEIMAVIPGNKLSRVSSTVVWTVDSGGGIHRWNVS